MSFLFCGAYTNIFFSAAFAEPSFVFADVIREGSNRVVGEDDKIYYFFTEVSVEFEFFGKLLIPRVARVCKVSTNALSAHTIYTHCLLFLCTCHLCLSEGEKQFNIC